MAWSEYVKPEVRALKGITQRSEAPPKDMAKNLIDLNQSVGYMSQMMGIMQGGIDDANKDILQKIRDAIDDILIIFGLGGGDTLNFDWGDLFTVFKNFNKIFHLPDFFNFGSGGGIDLIGLGQNFFDMLLKPLSGFGSFIHDSATGLFEFLFNLLEGVPFIGGFIQSIGNAFNLTRTKAITADTKANAVSTAVASGAVGQTKPTEADTAAYNAAKALYDLAAQTQADVVAIRQNENASGGGALQKTLMFPSGPVNTTDVNAPNYVYNGQLALAGGLGDAFYRAIINYLYTTDTQAINGSLGDNANADQASFLVLRASADYTSGVACRITATGVQIGTISNFVHGQNVSGWTSVSSLGRTMTGSDNVELRASGNIFVVLVNGTPVLSYNGVLGSIGSGFRGSFVVKQKASGAFGIVFYSFNFRSIGIYDFGGTGASVTNRVSCKISRLSTAAANLTVNNGAIATLPAGYYTATDYAQGMTVTDLSSGVIRADVSDWYNFVLSGEVFYQFGSGQAYWVLMVDTGDGNGFQQASKPILAGTIFPYPLAQGHKCMPAIANAMQYVVRTSNGDAAVGESRGATISQVAGGPGSFFNVFADK